MVVRIEKKFDTNAVVGQFLGLIRLPCADAHHVDAETVELALALTQLREQLEARQSTVVTKDLYQNG